MLVFATCPQLVDQLSQGLGGEPLAPELLPDPVADEPPAVLLPADRVAGDLVLEDDRLLHEGRIGEDSLPVGVEGLAVAWGEVGHGGRLRVALVLEEDGEVGLEHVPEQRHRSSLAAGPFAS
jgi:hypothetical protein